MYVHVCASSHACADTYAYLCMCMWGAISQDRSTLAGSLSGMWTLSMRLAVWSAPEMLCLLSTGAKSPDLYVAAGIKLRPHVCREAVFQLSRLPSLLKGHLRTALHSVTLNLRATVHF